HTSLQRLSLEEASSMKLTVTQGAAQVAADTLQQAIYCISLWVGLVWVNVDSSAAEMTSFLLLVSKLSHQVHNFKAQVEDVFNRSDNLAEHFEFLDQQPKIFPGTYDGPVSGEVIFQDVSFAYPTRPEQKVLHELSMELQPGKTTALVGASGSGKSTSVQLIFRYYDPLAGTILIDGVPMKDWDLTHLHRHM
ncbi:Tap2, partial [Symbiodinium pilosum]